MSWPVSFARRLLKNIRKRLKGLLRKARSRAAPQPPDLCAGNDRICVVAILKNEERFLAEWIAYHRLIGVDHFFLYDNDDALPLRKLLEPQREWVTVIDWPGDHAHLPGRSTQSKAYMDSMRLIRGAYEWVAIIDADEFIVLRRHPSLRAFLTSFGKAGAVQLNWHVFGHNGHYDDPRDLVTAALTRRMSVPSRNIKSITRTDAIVDVKTPHFCALKPGLRRVDANGRSYTDEIYPGKTKAAFINHYQCRSFTNWMGRAKRGNVCFSDITLAPPEHHWRFSEEGLLRQFVETVAKDKNEMDDNYMASFRPAIVEMMEEMGFPPPEKPEAS